MKRRLCSLLLLSVFICSILTACGGSSQPSTPASGPNNSQTSGTSQKDELSVQLYSMAPLSYTTGSGDRIYTSSGYYWDTTYHYKLRVEMTIKNTGDVVASIDRSLFTTYWDDKELSLDSINLDINNGNRAKLAPNEQTTVNLVYDMDKSQYDEWSVPGHSAKLVIRYGTGTLTYTYLSETGEVRTN